MNLTATEAAIAWAKGKRVEARGVGSIAPLSPITPVGGSEGDWYWSPSIFGKDASRYEFFLAPGETMEEAKPVNLTAPHEDVVDDGGPARDMSLRQHYAGLAMEAMVSCPNAPVSLSKQVAESALSYADALLAELRRDA